MPELPNDNEPRESPLTLGRLDGKIVAYLKVEDTVYCGTGDSVEAAVSDAMLVAFPGKKIQAAPGFGSNIDPESLPDLGQIGGRPQ
jgi:hypothetical protein